MATLTIDVSDFGAASHPDDFVTLWSPIFRRVGTTSKLVSTAPRRVYLTAGKASVDVEPGPLAVEMHCRNVADSAVREFNVPDGGGSLAELVEAYTDYEAPVVSRVHADLLAAIEAANEAAQSASDAAASVEVIGGAQAVMSAKSEAEAAASAAAQSASDAAQSASESSGSASDARGWANAAATSASNAASSAYTASSKATAAATSATNAKTSETNAASSESNAASSASDAMGWADSAAMSASNAATSATNARTSETNAASSASAASGSAAAAAQSASDAQAAVQAASGVPDATASTVVKRDASARAKFADPYDAQDAATKGYADNLVDWNNTLQHRLWGHVPYLTDGDISVNKVWLSDQGDFAASKVYVNNYVDASIIAAPKMHVWDGSGTWTAPSTAGPNDTVLNTATGEIYSVKVV